MYNFFKAKWGETAKGVIAMKRYRGSGTAARLSSLLLILIPLLICAQPVFADGTGVSISPQQQTVEQGEEFEVDVLISTDNMTRGAQFDLTFDPELVRVNSISEGAFYSGWASSHGGFTVPILKRIDNEGGRVRAWAVACFTGAAGGATGTGTLATIHMEALSDNLTGTSALTLSDVMVTGTDSSTIENIQLNQGRGYSNEWGKGWGRG